MTECLPALALAVTGVGYGLSTMGASPETQPPSIEIAFPQAPPARQDSVGPQASSLGMVVSEAPAPGTIPFVPESAAGLTQIVRGGPSDSMGPGMQLTFAAGASLITGKTGATLEEKAHGASAAFEAAGVSGLSYGQAAAAAAAAAPPVPIEHYGDMFPTGF